MYWDIGSSHLVADWCGKKDGDCVRSSSVSLRQEVTKLATQVGASVHLSGKGVDTMSAEKTVLGGYTKFGARQKE